MKRLAVLIALPLALSAQQIDWSQIKNKPQANAADYRFTRTNGNSASGDLSVAGASKTVTVAPCPKGINGANSSHYVYVGGGTGAAEAALVTGGTCTSAASSGTIVLTTANAHTGAWSLTSATAGMQEAIWALPSTGGRVLVEAGVFTLYAPVVKRAIPVYVQGAGQDATTFNVATTFALTHSGVFTAPDDLAVYNTAFWTSGGYSDFAVWFTQPNSNVLANYTHWPPAFYGYKTSRPRFERLTIVAAWDAITVIGYNGVEISDVNASFFHQGITLDQHVDASHIYNFHAWVFGLTPLQNEPFIWNPNVYALVIGKADDTQIVGYGGNPSLKFIDGWSGSGPLSGGCWVTMSHSDVDAGGILMNSPGGRLRITASLIGGTSGTDGDGLHLKRPVTYLGGELDISDSWIGYSDANLTAANEAIFDIDLSSSQSPTDQGATHVKLRGNRIYTAGDHRIVYGHTSGGYTGTIAVQDNRFSVADAPGNPRTWPIVDSVGEARVIATGNVTNDKYSEYGAFFRGTADMGHVVTDNIASNWSMAYPTLSASSIYERNQGIKNPIPEGTAVASAAYVAPTGRYFAVGGAAAIATIEFNVAAGANQVALHDIVVVPTGAFTWNASGNIAVAGTAVVGRPIRFVYLTSTSKWYPSYN